MDGIDEFELLYRCLKTRDIEILKHFDDASISDEDYFVYAIESDLISNGIGLVQEFLLHNLSSNGIDINARIIIESFTILQMHANGDIPKERFKIFRDSYHLVDYFNYKDTEISKTDYYRQEGIKKQKLIREIIGITGWDQKQIEKKSGNPNLYLSKNGEFLSFAKLIEKYPMPDEKEYSLYQYFSIHTHPFYLADRYIEDKQIRLNNIYIVLEYLMSFMKENNYYSQEMALRSRSLDEDLKISKETNCISNMVIMDDIFNKIEKVTCFFENGYDHYEYTILENFRAIFFSMQLLENLGYNEQVIIRFKPLIEMLSVQYQINSCKNKKEYDYIRMAFSECSYLQLKEYYENIEYETKIKKDKLEDVFYKYYCGKYDLHDYSQFLKECEENKLYFLKANNKENYTSLIKGLMDYISFPQNMKEDLLLCYRFSVDMGHAGGYSFNANEGTFFYFPHLCMHIVYTYLINLILHISTHQKFWHKSNEFKNIISILNKFDEHELQELDRQNKEIMELLKN